LTGRRLILVVGVYRSGTSLLAGILGQVGCHIPRPEVQADETNPRGFSEPRWVVDFHERLMAAALITVHDSRPAAWESTRKVSADPAVYEELRTWLEPQLQREEPVVIKDPRSVWFLPLWTRCAAELGVETSFGTTLRHPAETLASARKSYGEWQTDTSRATAWVNVMLGTERCTRDTTRAFVRYEDLLADWPAELRRIGAALELPALAGIEREHHPAVNGFVDPTLHRSRTRWEELAVPAVVRDMAEDVYDGMQTLTRPDGDGDRVRAGLDATRAAYDELYAEAEAIAQSSATLEILRARHRRPPKPEPEPPPPPPPPRPLWHRAGRRLLRRR
jgi:hypothetical protein